MKRLFFVGVAAALLPAAAAAQLSESAAWAAYAVNQYQVTPDITYLTAAPAEGGRLAFHPDLYGRDAPLLASLEGRVGPRPTQMAAR